MKILGIESSSLVASAALLTDQIITAEYTINHKKTHSQTLLPMIDEIEKRLEIPLSSVDAIAVSAGPGSFTGLRIGSATAKGLGLAWDKPLISVPTLEAMAYNFYGTDKLVCPIMDARRGQVYTGLYDFSPELNIVKPILAIDLKELLAELNTMNRPVIFAGDGIETGQAEIEAILKIPYMLAPPHLNRQRAASVAALGAQLYKNGIYQKASEQVPEYLRQSQAERIRKETLRGCP